MRYQKIEFALMALGVLTLALVAVGATTLFAMAGVAKLWAAAAGIALALALDMFGAWLCEHLE